MTEVRLGFCIAGTQKSGTTSLSTLLDQHPQVRRASKKELHWFDDEQRDWAAGDFSGMTVTLPKPRHRITGDGTPLYLWWPQALERIRAYNPDMRMIAIFRDPLDRLFSQWVMNVNRWPKAAKDWPVFIRDLRPKGLEDRIPEGMHIGGYRLRSGVVRGYYGQQLERGFATFGREQFRVLEFKAFLADHVSALDDLTDFLGLRPYREHPALPHGMAGKPQAPGTPPTGADIEELVELYRDDFALFKRLTGLDVSGWSLQRVLDGTLDPAELAATYAAKVVSRPA